MCCRIVVVRTAAIPAVATACSILLSSVMTVCSTVTPWFPPAISCAADPPTARRIIPILRRRSICRCSPVSSLTRSRAKSRAPFLPLPHPVLPLGKQGLRHLLLWQQELLPAGHGSAAEGVSRQKSRTLLFFHVLSFHQVKDSS